MRGKRLIEPIIIIIIFLSVFGINLHLLINTPLWADNARDVILINQILETGEVGQTHPYLLDSATSHMPILNPQLYYVEGAALTSIIGPNAIYILPALSSAFLILAIYLLTRFLIGNKGGIIATIASIPVYIFLIGVEADLSVAFLSILSILAFFKAIKQKNAKWLILTSIFVCGAIGMKQEGFFIFIFIAIAVIVYAISQWRTQILRNIKYGVVAIALAIILCFPVLWHNFTSSGSIVDPWFLPEPLNTLEEKTALALGIERYEEDQAARDYYINSGWNSSRESTATPSGIINYMNPFTQPKNEEALEIFYLVFFCLAIIFSLKTKNINLIILALMIFVLAVIHCIYQPLRNYFILLPIFSCIFLAYGIVMATSKSKLLWRSNIRIIITTLVILIFVVGSFFASISYYQNMFEISSSSQTRQTEYQILGDWIEAVLPKDAIILTSRTHDIAQYGHRNTIWLNGRGNVDLFEAFQYGAEDELITIMKSKGINYIFIDETWIGNPDVWPNYMSSAGVGMLKESIYFSELFETDNLSIYGLN